MATTKITNLSALGILTLGLADGTTFTFDSGRVWMKTKSAVRDVEVRNPERFGAVPTDSSRKGLAIGKAWITEFERVQLTMIGMDTGIAI